MGNFAGFPTGAQGGLAWEKQLPTWPRLPSLPTVNESDNPLKSTPILTFYFYINQCSESSICSDDNDFFFLSYKK